MPELFEHDLERHPGAGLSQAGFTVERTVLYHASLLPQNWLAAVGPTTAGGLGALTSTASAEARCQSGYHSRAAPFVREIIAAAPPALHGGCFCGEKSLPAKGGKFVRLSGVAVFRPDSGTGRRAAVCAKCPVVRRFWKPTLIG